MANNTCLIEDCVKPVRAHGYCNMHDLRIKRNGSPHLVKRIQTYSQTNCIIGDCNNQAFAKQLCKLHYDRVRRTGQPSIKTQEPPEICAAPNCDMFVKIKGFCKNHYRREADKKYRSEDPWRYRKYSSDRRKAVKQSLVIGFTEAQLKQRLSMFNFACWLCGNEANSIDHVKPLSKGGAHCLSNLRPACKSCNSKKRNKWFGCANLHRLIS